MEQAGAELAFFDPLLDEHLPAGCRALYAGGGFPEVFATQISQNKALLAQIRQKVRTGMTTWAECGGLLLLCESLDGSSMAGALKGVHARMTEDLCIGYRAAETSRDSVIGPLGTRLSGHEFHRTVTEPSGDALVLSGRFGRGQGGFCTRSLLASYLHQHLAGTPWLAEAFVRKTIELSGKGPGLGLGAATAGLSGGGHGTS